MTAPGKAGRIGPEKGAGPQAPWHRPMNRVLSPFARPGFHGPIPNCPRPAPMTTPLATYFHVHLLSYSTGETLNAMAKVVSARFDSVMSM